MTVSKILGCEDPDAVREKDDFYETPIECTQALLKAELVHWPVPGWKDPAIYKPEVIWEPACGKGAISVELKLFGFEVISTDLVDRGYGQPRIDFLFEYKAMSDKIITNPPFKLAHQFATHAHGLGIKYMAMLVKADFFCSQRTGFLFEQWRPARIYALTWRPDFKGGGAPPMTCCWVIWDGNPGPNQTTYHVLNKPGS